MPNIIATPRGPIHVVVMFATSSHNVLLPSSGKEEELRQSSRERVVLYLDGSNINGIAWL